MRVLLLSDSYAPQVNGVATSVRMLARSLTAAGHAVAVYTVRPRAGTGAVEPEDYTVERRPAVSLPLNEAFSVAAPMSRAAGRLVEWFRPDVMHCHSPFGIGWQGLRAGLTLGVPVLGTHHTLFAQYVSCYSRLGGETNQRVAALFRRYVAAFYNRCDLVTCASRFLAIDVLSGGLARPLRVIPNAVDIQRFQVARRSQRPAGDGEARLAFCGRLAYEKNLFRLLDLVEPALRRRPALTLRLIGDGPLRGALERDIARRGLQRQVVCTGWLSGDELAVEVAEADISVSASLTENQPLALLESMAAGVPVVALAAAGVPEIVRDGVTGRLVSPDADPQQFSERLERLIASPDLRAEMGMQARASVLRHSIEAHTTSMLAAYVEATARAQWRLKQKSTISEVRRGTSMLGTKRSLPQRY